MRTVAKALNVKDRFCNLLQAYFQNWPANSFNLTIVRAMSWVKCNGMRVHYWCDQVEIKSEWCICSSCTFNFTISQNLLIIHSLDNFTDNLNKNVQSYCALYCSLLWYNDSSCREIRTSCVQLFSKNILYDKEMCNIRHHKQHRNCGQPIRMV